MIDLSGSQIYDSSTVAALASIELGYRQRGKDVQIVGLDEPSRAWHTRLSGRLGAGHQTRQPVRRRSGSARAAGPAGS